MNCIKSFKNSACFIRILLLAFVLFFVSYSAEAFDLHKYGHQLIDKQFLLGLQNNPKSLRAVFLDASIASEPLIAYVYASNKSNKKITCRIQLPVQAVKVLKEIIVKQPLRKFTQKNADGNLFYSHGQCHSGTLSICDGTKVRLEFVPFQTIHGPNAAFIGDLGFLTWESTFPKTSKRLREVILTPFKKSLVTIAPRVQWNRYYTFRKSYYGLVHRLENPGIDLSNFSTWEPIIHKLTANKSVKNHEKKMKADMQIFCSFFKKTTGLLSQRERSRRGLVPGFVSLNWSRISETDIGTGNNQFLFMSLGSGINYFDNPWKQTRTNALSPRLLFYPEILNLENVQIYPTYSIEPKENGPKRLGAINKFQLQSNFSPTIIVERAIPMPIIKRPKVVKLLSNKLCQYGILNDSASLTQGFTFQNQSFRGNIVNNEVRIADFLYPGDWLVNVIVPPDTKKRYLDKIKIMRNSEGAIISPRGKPWSEIIVEAPFATDKGFRMAYLELSLKRSQPGLWRLCCLSRGTKQTPRIGYSILMNAINSMIKKTGNSFFQTKHYKLFRSKYRDWQESWCEYLEACRNNEPSGVLEKLSSRSKYRRREASSLMTCEMP